jgi:hypothetical protein
MFYAQMFLSGFVGTIFTNVRERNRFGIPNAFYNGWRDGDDFLTMSRKWCEVLERVTHGAEG